MSLFSIYQLLCRNEQNPLFVPDLLPQKNISQKIFRHFFLPDEEVNDLRRDVLEEGVDEVEDWRPEELPAEAEDESGEDGDLRLGLLRLLLPVLVPDGDDVWGGVVGCQVPQVIISQSSPPS